MHCAKHLAFACRYYGERGDPDAGDRETGESCTLPVRIRSGSCFDAVMENSALRLAQLRMAAAAGIDLPNGAQLTVLRYEPGQQFGGATEFPVPGLRVEPFPSRAMVFDNLKPDSTPEPDSLHADGPVEAGAKWLATLWIRQGHYRTF